MQLAVCVISNRDHAPDFTKSMMGLLAHLASNPFCDSVGAKIAKNCSLLPDSRQRMLDECLADGFTHALLLDDDMVFPSDLCHRLFASQKDLIGVNSLRKNPDYLHYTARDLEGRWLASRGRTGLQEVESVGLAIFLIKLSVLKSVPKPHFEVRWNENTQSYTGEDIYFIRKLRAAGHKVYINHDLSNECGHVGSLIYTFDFYDRFKDGNENAR
ncbi:MAG: hypothetical protein WC058_16355 [Phycisphaeraceae bacterium]